MLIYFDTKVYINHVIFTTFQALINEFLQERKNVFRRMTHLFPMGRSWVQPRNTHTPIVQQDGMAI